MLVRNFFFWLTFFVLFSIQALGQERIIKVHFLYGSKPARGYESVEKPWFGGKLGGHVGIEVNHNQVVSFLPKGEYHVFPKDYERHSVFITTTRKHFWETFGGNSEDMKKVTIHIPVTEEQFMKLDSIHQAYMENTPYDYAFFGMRCGAATYELLSQIDILAVKKLKKVSNKIFYPRRLRKQLLALAKENGWKIEKEKGTERRKWEED